MVRMSEALVHQLVADLGAHMGMAGLKLGAAGSCQLVFDQRWVVTLMSESGNSRFLLNCPLCTADQGSGLSGGMLRTLLEANFMGRGTAGAMLALAPDGRAYLQLSLSWDDASRGGLANRLEALLNQAEVWATKLAEAPPERFGLESALARPGAATAPWAFQRV